MFKNMNKEAVSAVVGVILMVAVTLAIAVTVYVYVDGRLNPIDGKQLSGQIIEKFRGYDYNNIYYFFTLENTTLDTIKDICVDETVYHLYDVGNYYDAYDVRG